VKKGFCADGNEFIFITFTDLSPATYSRNWVRFQDSSGDICGDDSEI
jgi:hypothetical protein